MLRKNYYTFLLTAALFLASGIAALAQTAPVRGKVVVKQTDGTLIPVADAVIDGYRTDLKGKLPSTKTNKKGEFSFAGLLAGARYALAVSAPNVSPQVFPGVKAGDEAITITVTPGDGKQLTEEEARQALIETAPPTGQTTELTAQQKKERDELIKKNDEITAKNKNIENTNKIINESLSEGRKAYEVKNYDAAIAKFDEGINAEPDFAGTAPLLLNYKGASTKDRGYDSYSQGGKASDAGLQKTKFEAAKKDWIESLVSFNRALQILKEAKETDPKILKDYMSIKLSILNNAMDTYRLLTVSRIDSTKSAEAKPIFEDYLATETDAIKKANAQITLGDIFREAGDSENAISAYRKGLEMSPDNPNALAGLGLSLFAAGASSTPENTAQEQEGLNYMQRFTEVAPDNHPLKASVKESVDYLKSKSLTPQKTNKTTPKKKP